MWFIGVEVEQEMRAPPPKKKPGSAPDLPARSSINTSVKKTCFSLNVSDHMSR